MRRVVLVLLFFTTAAAATAAPGLRVRDHLHWKGVTFRPDVRVWCGPWSADAGEPSIHITAGSRSARAGWQLSAVVADVQEHPKIRFPHSFVFDQPNGAELFAAAPGYEVSSATDKARGSITFTRASCTAGLRLAFRIDATLGSELSDGRSLRVKGTFSARVTSG
jgi:hypothetical protein